MPEVMTRKFMKTDRIFGLFLTLIVLALETAAQSNTVQKKVFVDEGSGKIGLYFMIFIILAGLGAAYFFWQRSRKGLVAEQPKEEDPYRNYLRHESFELEQFDATAELEWLRKAKKKRPTTKKRPKRAEATAPSAAKADELTFDTKVFQEKMKMLQYVQLPVNSFNELTPSKKCTPLPYSNERDLLTAIEQANEEFEEDEAIRELAVRILAAFRTQNSVEALSQIALYDLSANLRSKAVSILTDFDHESVFEAMLLACADPTREVRAAAARGLFRLNFDRSDAWKRIIETGDDYRMSHAVRAAIEAGITQKSFDRLVHEDLKVAYEAFTLVALMIKAGETKEIFEAIRDHRDDRVKFALLHVIRSISDPRMLSSLLELFGADGLSDDVVKRLNETVNSFDPVHA